MVRGGSSPSPPGAAELLEAPEKNFDPPKKIGLNLLRGGGAGGSTGGGWVV